MKERPILFNGEMVRAILEGRKTQTRRLVTTPMILIGDENLNHDDITCRYLDAENGSGFCAWLTEYPEEGVAPLKCPYGQPGDRLWVREKWNVARCRLDHETGTEFSTFEWNYDLYGDPQQHLSAEASRENSVAMIFYAAAGYHPSEFEPFSPLHGKEIKAEIPWRPSIHMPRWASRITLEVISVRVERLQEISEEEARAEGFEPTFEPIVKFGRGSVIVSARDQFAKIWDSIYSKRPGYSWTDNPWIWAVQFKMI